LLENLVQRVELRVGESVGAVQIDFFPGVKEALGADCERAKRIERGL